MKVTLFGIIISTSNRIKNILDEGMSRDNNIKRPHVHNYLCGVYDSRIFGICVYRVEQCKYFTTVK